MTGSERLLTGGGEDIVHFMSTSGVDLLSGGKESASIDGPLGAMFGGGTGDGVRVETILSIWVIEEAADDARPFLLDEECF